MLEKINLVGCWQPVHQVISEIGSYLGSKFEPAIVFCTTTLNPWKAMGLQWQRGSWKQKLLITAHIPTQNFVHNFAYVCREKILGRTELDLLTGFPFLKSIFCLFSYSLWKWASSISIPLVEENSAKFLPSSSLD